MKRLVFSMALIVLAGGVHLFPQVETADYSAAVLAFINEYRRAAGVPPVVLDEKLSCGCRMHAWYLISNQIDPAGADDPHDEFEGKIGFTPEGKHAGDVSIILDQIEPGLTIDYFMATFFHRIPVLSPRLTKIGFGCAHDPNDKKWKWATVIDVQSDQKGAVKNEFTLFPAEGQTDVPPVFGLNRKGFSAVELPNPIPDNGKGRRYGYPVTVTFWKSPSISNVRASLTGTDGSAIDCWVSDPPHPACPGEDQWDSICLIAKNPLPSLTAIKVRISCFTNGGPFRREWSFTTMDEKCIGQWVKRAPSR